MSGENYEWRCLHVDDRFNLHFRGAVGHVSAMPLCSYILLLPLTFEGCPNVAMQRTTGVVR